MKFELPDSLYTFYNIYVNSKFHFDFRFPLIVPEITHNILTVPACMVFIVDY